MMRYKVLGILPLIAAGALNGTVLADGQTDFSIYKNGAKAVPFGGGIAGFCGDTSPWAPLKSATTGAP